MLFENSASAWENQAENFSYMREVAAEVGSYAKRFVVCEGPSASNAFADACGRAFAFGTQTAPEESIESAVRAVFSFKPADIVTQLDLLRPIYSKTTNYGHFGKNDPDITWERTDKADALRSAV